MNNIKKLTALCEAIEAMREVLPETSDYDLVASIMSAPEIKERGMIEGIQAECVTLGAWLGGMKG